MDNIDMDKLRDRIKQRCDDLGIKRKDLANKSGVSLNTINTWYRKNEVDAYGNPKKTIPKIDALYPIAVALDTSIDYLVGRVDFIHAGNEDMSNFTGLSDTAIECLRGWYKDKQQAAPLHQYSNDTDTLNMILEYYGKRRVSGFSLFHFIGNFFNAHKFKRVQQDMIRYQSGSYYNTIEAGDKIIKQGKRKSEVIEKLCTPINSQSFRGQDTTKLDIVNSENESEQYYIELSSLYREHCKSQIMDILKKIGGIK